MPRSYIIKILFVFGIIAYVFSNIQWQDHYRQRIANGTVTEVAGEIFGTWDRAEVHFLPKYHTSKQPLVIRKGLQPDGSNIEFTPGIFTYILNFNLYLLPLSAISYFLCVSIAGTRWWWLLHISKIPASWLEVIRYTWIGVFFNNVIPGQTGGDVIKAGYLMKEHKTMRVPVVLSILVDRTLGLSSLLLLGAIATFSSLDRFADLAIGICTLLAVLVSIMVLLFSRRIRRCFGVQALLKYMPLFLRNIFLRVHRSFALFRGHILGLGLCLLVGMVAQSLSIFTVVILGKGLGVGLPVLEYFALIPLITIVSSLPLSPNGWGVGELAFGYIFSTYGANHLANLPFTDAELAMRTRGVALSILFRIHSSLLSMLGGLLLMVRKDRPG